MKKFHSHGIAVLISFCLIGGTTAAPRGVFSLTSADDPISSQIIDHPSVAGVVVRGHWPDVEPAEGAYDWAYFDTEIDRVAAAGKQVSLVITTGGRATPQWVFQEGVRTFSYVNGNQFQDSAGDVVTIPLFWDPVFLEKKINFIRAMGARYSGHPDLVSVHAHCANASTDDWNVPATADDVDNWLDLGFSAENLLSACEQVIDATMEAFPSQSVRIAIGRVDSRLVPDPDFVAEEIIRYANQVYPGRLIAQRHNLNANTPDPLGSDALDGWEVLWNNRPAVAAQMVWPASDETTCRMNGQQTPCDARTMLQEAVTIGTRYEMQYLEIYGADVMNPELNSIIELAADLLAGSDEVPEGPDVTPSDDSPPPVPLPPPSIDGDFNQDGCIDGSDADGLARAIERHWRNPKWDLNDDGALNSTDLQTLSSLYTNSGGAACTG